MNTRSVGDDVLRWASENGAGRWRDLSEAIANASAGRRRRGIRSWILASELSDLGHIDIDWDQGSWSVAPPVLALSPGMGFCAYLAGWRNSALCERFDQATDDLATFPFPVLQDDAPGALFVKCSSIGAIEDLADRMGVALVLDPCAQLSELVSLPSHARLPGAPPPPGEALARFAPATLAWTETDEAEQAGLYRFELHGRRVFRLHEDDDWFIVDRAVGQLRVLAGRDDVVCWHPPSADGRMPRALTVARDVSLPSVAARAAVAASGLLPKKSDQRRAFLNVSRPVAARIADRLGLTLSVARDPIQMEN